MKIIYLIMMFSLTLFGTSLFPHQASALTCQSKTAIVYGNGMFNDWKEANRSRKQLIIKIQTYSPASQYLAEFEVYLAYASDRDGLGTTVKDQLLEIYYMTRNDRIASFWRWLSGIEAAPQWFQDYMISFTGAMNALTYLSDPDFQNQLSGDGTNENPGYRMLLNGGNRVVIVSHSQGNYYANAVYDTLTNEKPERSLNIGIVAVATPASRVADGKNRHITVPEDFIIKPVRILETNPLQGDSKNVQELSPSNWIRASLGHNFIHWYLAGTFTRDTIMGLIVSTIESMPAAYKHDKSNVRSRFAVFRCINETVSSNGFAVEFNNTSKTLLINSKSLDSLATSTFTDDFSAVFPYSAWVYLVPVPNGVGVVYTKSRHLSIVFMDPGLNASIDTSENSIHMIAYTWDKATDMWSSYTSAIQGLSFSMNYQNPFCYPSACTEPAPVLPVYPDPVPVIYDPNPILNLTMPIGLGTEFIDSWMKTPVAIAVGTVDEKGVFPWKKVIVQNGVLALGGGGSYALQFADATQHVVIPPVLNVGEGFTTSTGLSGVFPPDVLAGNYFGPLRLTIE